MDLYGLSVQLQFEDIAVIWKDFQIAHDFQC